MAIAVTDELRESVGSDSNRALMAVCGRSGFFLQTIAQAGVALTESGSDDHVWQHELVSVLKKTDLKVLSAFWSVSCARGRTRTGTSLMDNGF